MSSHQCKMTEEEPVKRYNEKFLRSWESTVIAFEMGLTLLCFGAVLCGQWSWCSGCWIISFFLMLCSILSFLASCFIFLHQMFLPMKELLRKNTDRKINWKTVIMYQCWISSSGFFLASILQSLFSGMMAAFQVSSVLGFIAYKLYVIHGFIHFYKRKVKEADPGELSASDDSSEEGVMGVVVKNELTFDDTKDTTDDNQPQLSRIRRLSDTSQERQSLAAEASLPDSSLKIRYVKCSFETEGTSDDDSSSDNLENCNEDLANTSSSSEKDPNNSYDLELNKL